MVEKGLQGGVRIPTLRGENYDTVAGSEKPTVLRNVAFRAHR
ncbi:MAG: hypothetical protein QOJ42_5509 [Acidobacteriaceae bacterium]|jgi:hypothetical protein|nr:hypothetical protein [Acidobacteriaceae bacterium]